jgi:SHS2 domain-containing protein
MTEHKLPETGHEILEHTGDAGVRAWGPTPVALFLAVAQGLYRLAVKNLPTAGGFHHAFTVSGEMQEDRLVEFLAELIYLLTTRNWVATDLHLTFSARGLEAAGLFAEIAPEQVLREVKSPTYHRLQVKQGNEGWSAEIYFDL